MENQNCKHKGWKKSQVAEVGEHFEVHLISNFFVKSISQVFPYFTYPKSKIEWHFLLLYYWYATGFFMHRYISYVLSHITTCLPVSVCYTKKLGLFDIMICCHFFMMTMPQKWGGNYNPISTYKVLLLLPTYLYIHNAPSLVFN